MIIKEWKCPLHGSFDGSHAICPAYGCDSDGVEREYRTAPGIKSDSTKLTDAGFRRTADVYGLSDMNNKDGQAVAGHEGSQAIWGADKLPSYGNMLEQAKAPLTVNGKTDKNRGMQLASELTGTFGGHVVPVAGEITVHKGDKRGIKTVKNR